MIKWTNRYSYDEGTPDSANFREPDDLFHESDSDALEESTDRASSFSSLGNIKVELYRHFLLVPSILGYLVLDHCLSFDPMKISVLQPVVLSINITP